MNPLSVPEIFFNIFLFLDLKDIIILSITSKEIFKLSNDDNIWKMKYFKNELVNYDYSNKNFLKLKHKSYKDYVISSYLRRTRIYCGECNDYLFENVLISYHNCLYHLKKCINCKNEFCECNDINSYHKCCLQVHQNNKYLYRCPLCFSFMTCYLINLNI